MKKNGKTSKIDKTDLEQKTRVLLEDVRHGLKMVAEGHGLLAKRLDGHEEKLNEISDVVRKLQMDTESIKSQVEMIDIKTDRIEREIGTVKNAVMDVSHEIKDHEKRIKKVEEKVLI